MKLKTELHTGNGKADVYYNRDFEVEHDAAAAHALLQSLGRWHNPQSEWLQKRADEIMRGWGFGE